MVKGVQIAISWVNANGCMIWADRVFSFEVVPALALFVRGRNSFEYSKSLNDFKVALYIYPNYTDICIHPDNGYLDTLEQPWRTTLKCLLLFVIKNPAQLHSTYIRFY